MKRIFNTSCLLVFLLCYSAYAQKNDHERDGKLLHGDKWIKFSYPDKADFYVSPSGNDSWTGTLPEPDLAKKDGPFLTIERAQKAVRHLKSQVFFPKDAPVEKRWIGSPHPLGKGKDIVVYIRAGHYYLKSPLKFEPVDGGERVETNLPTGAFEYHKLKDHYVTYAAYPGENPVISGEIPVTGWRRSGKARVASLDADTAAMLIVDGRMQTLARAPDAGYFVPPAISKSTSELFFNKGDIRSWKDLEGNRVIMLLRWHTGINSIVRVDEKKGVASFRSPQEGVVIVPPRYYIENIKALMDAPGEWFFDKKTGELSYIPAEGIGDPEQVKAGVSVLGQLVDVQGSAITYKYAHACEFADNVVRSCGGTGIYIREGCYQTRVLNNKFETIDEGGIYAVGPASPADGKEITRETLISRNKFYNCGGLNIYSSYTLLTTISHNYITRTRGRYGIDVGGWANQEEAIDGCYTVEFNHLDNVQLGADDSGAIKTAGMTFNSVVRGNLIHNVNAGFFNDNVGFWFDNMLSGWSSEENIFYNLEQGEMKLCAALPEDNNYINNFTIEPPLNDPEMIIDGKPEFSATARNLTSSVQKIAASIFMDNNKFASKSIELKENASGEVIFEISPPPGNHKFRIENSSESELSVFESVSVDFSKSKLPEYCSAKAQPYTIESDANANRFTIVAGGPDKRQYRVEFTDWKIERVKE